MSTRVVLFVPVYTVSYHLYIHDDVICPVANPDSWSWYTIEGDLIDPEILSHSDLRFPNNQRCQTCKAVGTVHRPQLGLCWPGDGYHHNLEGKYLFLNGVASGGLSTEHWRTLHLVMWCRYPDMSNGHDITWDYCEEHYIVTNDMLTRAAGYQYSFTNQTVYGMPLWHSARFCFRLPWAVSLSLSSCLKSKCDMFSGLQHSNWCSCLCNCSKFL